MPVTSAEEAAAASVSASGSGKVPGGTTTTVRRSSAERLQRGLKAPPLDPTRRYLSCNLAHGKAFVDFVNPRDDDMISIAVSFMKARYHTKKVRAGVEFAFNETFIFEFEGADERGVYDPALLLKLSQPWQRYIHLTILRHRGAGRPVVIGTKNLDWRPLLYANSVELNAGIMPVDPHHSGSLGLIQLNLDLLPNLKKQELVGEDQIIRQQELEKKFEAEAQAAFLDYANSYWAEYK